MVTLSGTVASESDKAQAESLTKAAAGGLVVANTVAVRPPGDESAAKAVDSDLDKAIEKNLDAALVKRKLDKGVHYDVKNGVVTLKGDAGTQNRRSAIEQVANGVPDPAGGQRNGSEGTKGHFFPPLDCRPGAWLRKLRSRFVFFPQSSSKTCRSSVLFPV